MRLRKSFLKISPPAIGSALILSGKKEHRKPFEATATTCHVDSLNDFKRMLLAQGACILVDTQEVPTGINMTLQHPDGLIVEYMERK